MYSKYLGRSPWLLSSTPRISVWTLMGGLCSIPRGFVVGWRMILGAAGPCRCELEQLGGEMFVQKHCPVLGLLTGHGGCCPTGAGGPTVGPKSLRVPLARKSPPKAVSVWDLQRQICSSKVPLQDAGGAARWTHCAGACAGKTPCALHRSGGLMGTMGTTGGLSRWE